MTLKAYFAKMQGGGQSPTGVNAVDLRHSLMRASDVKGCIHEQLNQDMR